MEGYIQKELDGLVRNKEIYKNLASDYKNRARQRWEQCLKMEYRAAKGNNNKTGRDWTSITMIWTEYILGHCPALRPPFVLDTSAGGLSVEPNHKGVRVDRSSDSESSKTDKFIYSLTCSYILVRCTCHFCRAFRKGLREKCH